MQLKRTIFCALVTFSILGTGAQSQTYDPQGGTSPLSLLAAPSDGIAYYEAKERVRALIEEKKYTQAEPQAEELVRQYPRDSENWRLLAELKWAAKKYPEAAEAYKKAGALWGWGIGSANGYMAAASYLAHGDKAAALKMLRWLINEQHGYWRAGLYTWPEFEALKNDPEFLKLIGRVDTTGWSRTKGWLYDLGYLYDELKRVNPDFRDKPFPEEFSRRYEQLKQNVGKLSDEEMFFGMQRMLATLRQGHVTLWADETAKVPNRFLPIKFYAFPEGIFVIGANEENDNLVGSRVIAIGRMPAEEALRRRAEATSVDGEMAYLWGIHRLAETYYLKGMGAIDTADMVKLTLQTPGGKQQEVKVSTLSKQMEGRQDKLVAPKRVAAPLFLTDLQRTFWERSLPERHALYVQLNNIMNGKDETLDQYGHRLWAVLEKNKPRNLILDLRHNNGGTTQLYPNLLRTLVAFSRSPGNKVYALIGRRTFSAAGNFVTDLERLVNPVFVGEASSECCNLYGDPTVVLLPYSNIKGELTAVKWQLSEPGDRRREMSPDVPVQLTAKAFFAGEDPVLETVFRMIARKQQLPARAKS